MLGARFDNLKDGAPAVVKAPAPAGAPATAPASAAAPARRLNRSTIMWITRVSIRNPVFATMVMVAIAVLGLFAYNRLRVEQMPDVSLPFVLVLTSYPGASPEVVETDVTKPLEYAINTVSGRQLIRSNSNEGRSEVFAEFRMATDMGKAMQDVRDKIAQVRARLPARRQGPAGDPRRPREPAAGRVDRRAVADARPAQAHLADRPDDRQGAGERPRRCPHRRQRPRDAADPDPDPAAARSRRWGSASTR